MLHIVGIDIGSVALSVAVIDEKGAVVNSFYQFHSIWKISAPESHHSSRQGQGQVKVLFL